MVPARFRGFALFCLAVLVGCPAPGEPEKAARKSQFPSPEEARRYILTRLLFAPAAPKASDPYSATLPRRYTTLQKKTSHYYLVDSASRELALAEGFEAHGFTREALAHYRNLAAYYPETSAGRTARVRTESCRERTVLGFVTPLSPILEDAEGERYLPLARPAPPAPDVERIQEPYLGPSVKVEGALTVVGFVDDAGRLAQGTRDESTVVGGWKYRGVISQDRRFVRVPAPAGSLFDVERHAKARLLLTAPTRAIAEAWIYLGKPEAGLEILKKLGETAPADPLQGDLDAIAADSLHPLRLDALWTLQALRNPSFTLSTKSAVTTGETIPVHLDSKNIDRMEFEFARLKGPIPPLEKDLKEWLKTAPAATSHTVSLAVDSNRTTLALPVREPGSYRVTARAGGLSCDFTVVRADASLDVHVLPGETVFHASRAGFSVSSANRLLGVTDAGGLATSGGMIRGALCDEHRSCCAGCESCAHHHGNDGLASKPQVLVAGNGQFFLATAEIDLKDLKGVTPPALGPIALVTTDRPAYKVGDTIRFHGIVRIPKTPRSRQAEARLVPAVERKVAVAIASEEATLFKETFTTGEFGTFSGSFMIPLTSARTEYTLTASLGGVSHAHAFEVTDYRKRDASILLEPTTEGFRIQAGYVWGAPIPGARIRCRVDGKEMEAQGDFLPLENGARVLVELMKDGESLARKMTVFHRPDRRPAPAAAPADPEPAPVAETPPAAPPAKPAEPPVFTVRTDKPIYGRGETVEVSLSGPWKKAEATVVVGDAYLYDLFRVPMKDGVGTLRFPVRSLFDPGSTIFAVCNGLRARVDFESRAARLDVSIDAPADGRPGQQIDVTLRADPNAAITLAAVDEAIFMIREDETPELYWHFYPARPAAHASASFGNFEFDGETHKREREPADDAFKTAALLLDRPFRGAGTYDVIGGGGGGGGRYGSRLGGKRNLVARGGGGAGMTEDAVFTHLKGLAPLQKPDGSWQATYATDAGTITPVGATALATLSFSGAGYTYLSKDTYGGICFGDVVRKGTQWLMDPRNVSNRDRVLNEAIRALALSEAYGLTGSKFYRDPGQNALDRILSLQSSDGGWNRSNPGANGEILPTVFAVMAIQSAQISGLTVPAAHAERAWEFFDRSVFEDGLCAEPATTATTGGSLLAMLFLRRNSDDARIARAAGWLVQHRPSWGQKDFLGWYLAGLALFNYDGPGGPTWKAWNQGLKDLLVRKQGKDGIWTHRGEKIVTTALAGLSLEVYYRYANVFGAVGGTRPPPPLAPAPRLRVRFPDTVHWAPDVLTGPDGRARVSFALPDTITTTRLTARGVDGTGAVGEAVSRIRTKQPFFIKLRCPEFAVLGDEIEVRAELFNYTGRSLVARVRPEGHPAEVRKVPTDRPASISWRVRAEDPEGLRIRVEARAGDASDAIERVIPVRRVEKETWKTIRGTAKAGGRFEFDASDRVRDVVVKVHPRKGSMTKILDALRYLNDYPYG